MITCIRVLVAHNHPIIRIGLRSIFSTEGLAQGLEEIQQRLAPHFERAEPRAQAMSYIKRIAEYNRTQKWMALGRIG